jgi:hypothetical protein
MTTLENESGMAPETHAVPRLGLFAIARHVFLRWELLRIPFNVILAVATIWILGLDEALAPQRFLLLLEGAFVANVLYFAGPIGETYFRWLGVGRVWVRFGLFVLGTTVSVALVVIALKDPQLAVQAQGKPTSFSTMEVSGPPQERVTAVTRQLSLHKAPPTALLDARYVQEQTGDGVLGPSDYRTFCRIDVAPADVPRWIADLTPLTTKPDHAAPKKNIWEWWITPEGFESLEFYEAKPYTGRVNGWIGVDPNTGRIFIFSFTM